MTWFSRMQQPVFKTGTREMAAKRQEMAAVMEEMAKSGKLSHQQMDEMKYQMMQAQDMYELNAVAGQVKKLNGRAQA